jgi:hypothetical protein
MSISKTELIDLLNSLIENKKELSFGENEFARGFKQGIISALKHLAKAIEDRGLADVLRNKDDSISF